MRTYFTQYTREFGYNLRLAYPVIIGLVGHTLVQLVDNIMVGQLGTAELAAVSLGNSFVFIGLSLGIGFSTAITPLVAESDGEGDIPKGRKIFYHSLILCLLLGIILALFVLSAQPLLFSMGQPPEVAELAYPYLFWVGLSLIPLVSFQALKQFSDGLSHTRPPMYATLFANVVNVVVNYVLIFGIGPFPALGIVGAALGTFIARWCMVFFLVLYMRYDKRYADFVRRIKMKVLDLLLLRKIISLGFPSAMQMFFEVGFFTIAIWMSGLLGKNPQAANQIALNLSSMTYM
ncbi:MAG: MATE family efflux transporter, partial [Flavobacteriales bacterium]